MIQKTQTEMFYAALDELERERQMNANFAVNNANLQLQSAAWQEVAEVQASVICALTQVEQQEFRETFADEVTEIEEAWAKAMSFEQGVQE